MEALSDINNVIWGPIMLALLGGVGFFLTIGLGFLTWRKIKYAFSILLDKNQEAGDGGVKPSHALWTALSATVGTGNIAGVATAIALGGPGAIFYMWLIALFGMATKYAEAVVAVKFREQDSNGNNIGGPMYYLRNGVGGWFGATLGLLFAVFGAVAAFGIGNGVQINSMADVLNSEFGFNKMLVGIIVAALVGFVILGGVKRIGEVASKLVPTMIILYIAASLFILIGNATEIPSAFALIFSSAFTGTAATGGFAGAAVAAAVRFGVARGVFSNESGLGSAAIAHAASKTNDPVKQGLIAMLGTFIDTLVVCTMTALVIITSGAWTTGENGAPLTAMAFDSGIPTAGGYIIAVALAVFSFTTLLGWCYYGERCWQYVFQEGVSQKMTLTVYRIAFVIAIYFFASVKVDFVWLLSDTFNGMMAIPNLIGLAILSPIIFKISREYWKNK
jgi:AGCS family alanine or glycine:cation symporter